jgi:hypothetical protein
VVCGVASMSSTESLFQLSQSLLLKSSPSTKPKSNKLNTSSSQVRPSH